MAEENVRIIKTGTVIIGAGISGLAAGVNFLSKGYNDFVIFEALERIGGRFCTIKNGEHEKQQLF